MFTAAISQVLIYLIFICLFSISLLVFINASVSFVVTTIIGKTTDVGNAVGTLGFADEVVVIIACPLWGILSDHIGARTVCVVSYAIIGIALGLFVQARNVIPQLLLIRLLFSLGAAGISTMITAMLPTIVADNGKHSSTDPGFARGRSQQESSISSEVTVTPSVAAQTTDPGPDPSPTRSAGLVGIFSGCGALLALLVFLRLPDLIQRHGVDPAESLKETYYIVAVIALLSSVVCIFGLRNLHGEAEKGWKNIIQPRARLEKKVFNNQGSNIVQAITLGFRIPSLGLAYLGGFVARASSIGITLFIPLLVNTSFISSGQCDTPNQDPLDTRRNCRSAYVLSAKLTGVSQLVGLLSAPIFGFLADRYQQYNVFLLLAALLGCIGYLSLTVIKIPEVDRKHGSYWIYGLMALLGVNQIGAIICSLGIFSRCVLGLQKDGDDDLRQELRPGRQGAQCVDFAEHEENQESTPLLANNSRFRDLHDLKGSIAGIYSLAGGVGILLLTKLGGVLFDRNTSAPFIMLALFNALLFMAGIICGLRITWSRKIVPDTSAGSQLTTE